MLKGVILDMDGTITKPYIDWKALRAEIGVPPDQMIMHYIDSLEGEAKAEAEGILVRRENEAATHSELNEGIRELVAFLEERGLKTALVTNNCRSSVDIILGKHDLCFDLILSREDGQIKPSGDLIVKALARMGLRSDEAILIGDGRLDIEASEEAGVVGVYLSNGSPAFEHHPTVHSAREAIGLIEALPTGGAASGQGLSD